MNLFPSELDRKRRKVAELIAEKNQAKLRFLGENPTMDVNPADFERHTDVRVIERDLRNASEEHIDMLLDFYEPTTVRYVW